MNKRRDRTLQDLCDASPNLSQPQVTPLLKGNIRKQGPVDEACSDFPIHMVAPQTSKGFSSYSDGSPTIDYREKAGKCNVCSAPCSSCFHVNKVLMKPEDESALETCADNIVACGHRRCEIGQPSEVSAGAGMNLTSDSVSENAVGKPSSRISDASASDDNVVCSKSEGRRLSEGHDDCLSCISGTEEHLNRKSDSKDSWIKFNESNVSRESSEKMPHSSSPAELYSQISGLVEIPNSKTTIDGTDTVNAHKTYSDGSNAKYLSRDPNPIEGNNNKHFHLKDGPFVASTEQMDTLPSRDVASDVVCCDPPTTALKSVERIEDMDVEIHATNETDDSDMVEQDVKVCDICGDAGREDLLAICSRCSDGAEHTYCMRVMVTEVPEGQWLCEECKSVDQGENETQEKIGKVDNDEKNNTPGQASTEYANSSDLERQRTKCHTKGHGKRLRDDVDTEVSSVVKKLALESIGGSPKSATPSKTAALSRDDSLKNSDKGRLRSSYHPSSETFPVNDTPESAISASDPQRQKFRGNFSKSYSFSSLNSKPNVKPVDQVVIPKQKSVRGHASLPLKEGFARSTRKSLSFKSTNSSRSESKIKMLSPRLSHASDIKHTKHRTALQRQQSCKTEYPSVNSITGTPMNSASRIDKRPAPRGESSSLIPIANHHGIKPVQTDNKSAALSRSLTLAARRSATLAARSSADISSSLGEFKRPTMHGQSIHGVSSVNEFNIGEQKSKLTSLKQDSSGPVVDERPSLNANEGSNDGFPQPRESTDCGERVGGFSGSRFSQPFVRPSRDESNNLKAAIDATVLRKPGLNTKHKPFGQFDYSSMTRAGCEVASHRDHMSSSPGKKKFSSDAGLLQRPTISHGLIPDSRRHQTANNVQQFPLVPVQGLSSGGRDGAMIAPSSRDILSSVPETIPFILQPLAIPELEYIWQGSFEVSRSGNGFDLWDGLLAHLSTCASPRVVEAANKFKSRIVLYEVPRLSTWPLQFQESGVKEDNIALFFFAKDFESYEKIYKVLLDNMIRNDLALKGNVNGVELLIFPSNQLPENSQRWNNLFFLWGVFRGKKESCFPPIPKSANQVSDPQDIPPAIISLPENRCSLRPIAEDFHVSGDAARVLEIPASEDLCRSLSSRAVSVDCSTKLSSVDQVGSGFNSTFSVAVQTDSPKQCLEIKNACQDENISSSCRPPLQVVGNCSYSGRKQMLIDLETPLDEEQSLHHLSVSAAGTSNMAPPVGIGVETMLNRTNIHHVELRIDTEHQSMDGERLLKEDRGTRDLNMEQNRCLPNHTEGLSADLCLKAQTLYPVASQVLLNNDDRSDEACGALEKITYMPFATHTLQNQWQEAGFDIVIPYSNENSERCLFPAESQPVTGLPFVDGPTSSKKHALEQDQVHDRAPNLELALGAEIKPMTQAILPLLDQKMRGENILQQARTKEEDDATAASLSLSLSFPFPEKEQSAKPGPRTEQLVSEREHVKTPMPLFGGLGDN